MACPRCLADRPVNGEYCRPCRDFLLGDSAVDPRRSADSLSPARDWPFRAWGPLVDLRDPDDLAWIQLS